MKILVCVKHVPCAEDMKLDRETKTLIRTNGAGEINPLDKFALELALRVKEQLGGSVTVISMGPDSSKASIRYSLSVGADKGYLLSDRALGGADAYATAITLAAAIRKLEAENGAFDLVLCGKNSSDGDTFLVPPALAENLGVPHATGVINYEISKTGIVAKRETELGYDKVELPFPALLSVGKAEFECRFPNVRLRLAANRYEIPVYSAADLGLAPETVGSKGSMTDVGSSFVPEHSNNCIIISGADESESAAKLVSLLRNAAVI